MGNRLFNVNGKTDEMLRDALRLAFTDEYGTNTCDGWVFDPKCGLILLGYADGHNKFPAPLTADEVFPIVLNWLKSKEASTVELGPWEDDCDHDGHNTKGWRVYVGDGGHVGNHYTALCAVKSVYLWYGK